MSKTILAQVDGWTPVIDAMVKDVGLMTAIIFGKAWRYCQMSDGVCKASQDRMADELGISRATINAHLSKLTEAGYLNDLTPNLLGLPHQYADTGKANLSISLTATCKNDLHLPVKNIDTKILVKETNKETKKMVAKPQKPPPHPAVLLFRATTKRYPNEANYQTVIDTILKMGLRLGRDVTSDDLKPFYSEWVARGYNSMSIKWLEWAGVGVIQVQARQSKPQAGDALERYIIQMEAAQ